MNDKEGHMETEQMDRFIYKEVVMNIARLRLFVCCNVRSSKHFLCGSTGKFVKYWCMAPGGTCSLVDTDVAVFTTFFGSLSVCMSFLNTVSVCLIFSTISFCSGGQVTHKHFSERRWSVKQDWNTCWTGVATCYTEG